MWIRELLISPSLYHRKRIYSLKYQTFVKDYRQGARALNNFASGHHTDVCLVHVNMFEII